jgi:hypothetical protein
MVARPERQSDPANVGVPLTGACEPVEQLLLLTLAARPARRESIDAGKKFLVVCVMTGPLEGEPKTEIRKFGTIVAELELLRDWLIGEGCSHAVMESTGLY